MDLLEHRANLQTRVSDVLRSAPAATALHVFGSGATPYVDGYADLDMQLLSADLDAARAVWPHILERVGPIEVARSIGAEATAYSVVFVHESLYHKLDISITDSPDVARSFGAPHNIILWTQEGAPRLGGGAATTAYVPPHDGIGHTIVGELMGVVRYVKARKRGHNLTCWRFMRSNVDRMIRLTDEQRQGWSSEQETFTTWDYKALDQHLGAARERIHDFFDWSTPLAMDRCLWDIVNRIMLLLAEKANHRGEVIPTSLVERHMAFIRDELGADGSTFPAF